MRALPRIMVAPNGARRTKADHPALPITADEIVADAIACRAAGADGLHAHIRDAQGDHLLDAGAYRALLGDLRRAVPDMGLQITTEAAGVYGPDMQMEVALGAGADMVSVAIREIARAGWDVARDFYAECAARGIAVQHILFDPGDGAVLQAVLPKAQIAAPALQLLFVLGRYASGGASAATDLAPFLDWMHRARLSPDWAVCAFGPRETDCLVAAARAGGKCRVGFENALTLADGRVAANNAEKVTDLIAALDAAGVGQTPNPADHCPA